MSNIRKLYLQNAAGDRYGLNGETGIYASNLSGFGFSLSPALSDLGRGFFVASDSEKEPLQTIAFTLTFTRAPYQSYDALVNWIFRAGRLTLVYEPIKGKEYWRDISVKFMQKSELNKVGWLELPCSFQCSTPWYLPTPAVLRMEADDSENTKIYDYAYSEELRYGLGSDATLSATISGDGHVPGAFELIYFGAITNPRIRLTGNISGKTYGLCSVSVALGDSDRLLMSTQHENSYIKRVGADGLETDLLDSVDLRHNPFFHLPVDEPCTLSIESDAEIPGVADLLVYYYYRSV